MEKQNQKTKNMHYSSFGDSPILELANLRLHDVKNPIWAAYFFSQQLPKSKAKRNLESTLKKALKIVASDLSANKLSGNAHEREAFVGVISDLMKSAEGPILYLSANKSHHSEDRQHLEGVLKNHSTVVNRLDLIFSDYSMDNAFNLANGVCENISERLYSMGKRVVIRPILNDELRNIKVHVDDFANFYSIPINNSADSLGNEGHIEVYGGIKGDYLELKVIDNGKGMPASVLAKLRDPTEVGVTYGKENGSGFGIPTLRQTLNRYGGKFDIYSKAGRTEVSMRIPLESLAFKEKQSNSIR